MFRDISATELSLDEMKMIEGEGWKNGLAYAIDFGGISLSISFLGSIFPGVNVDILANTIFASVGGFLMGYSKSDSRCDDYVKMGFGWFDWLEPNLD